MLTLCVLFRLFIAPSHFTLFDFGMCSHDCTERGWRSKSVSFSIAFYPFLWNRLSLSLVLADWLTGWRASEFQETFLSLPFTWWNNRHIVPCQDFYVAVTVLNAGLHGGTAHSLHSHLSSLPLLVLWAPNQSLCLFLFLHDCVFLFCGSRISMARAMTLQYSHLNSEIHFSSELAIL